jgi:hypothetical protein
MKDLNKLMRGAGFAALFALMVFTANCAAEEPAVDPTGATNATIDGTWKMMTYQVGGAGTPADMSVANITMVVDVAGTFVVNMPAEPCTASGTYTSTATTVALNTTSENCASSAVVTGVQNSDYTITGNTMTAIVTDVGAKLNDTITYQKQ